MNNYHYIIVGLPYLVSDFGSQSFSYEAVASGIKAQLSKKDLNLVKWLEFGYDPTHLCAHFYYAVDKKKDHFLREYFDFDHKIRNAQVKYLSKKLALKDEKYLVGEFDNQYDEYSHLMQIFETPNVIEREKALDLMRWEKISNIIVFEYFDIDVILAFLAKGNIVRRWLELDKTTGAELFKKLVDEVRGSFKGIDFK